MKYKPTLIVDSNAMAYRSLYTVGGLSNSGDKTGIIFGFLHQIFSFAKKFKTTDIIFCWDSRKSLRRIIWNADYKMSRVMKRKVLTKEELKIQINAFSQFDKLRESVLYDLGFRNIFHREGLEADDLIACVLKKIRGKVLILTNDEDLYQLINSDVSYFNLRTKEIMDEKAFINKYTISPKQWSEVKAIAGCKGDDVKGIKGVGEKKAINFILNRGTDKDREKIIDHSDIIEANKKLVCLPFQNVELKISKNKFTVNKFVDVFHEYNFKSFFEKSYFSKIETLFCGG